MKTTYSDYFSMEVIDVSVCMYDGITACPVVLELSMLGLVVASHVPGQVERFGCFNRVVIR